MHFGLHVNYPLCLSQFVRHEFSRHVLEKESNVKYHEKPSSGSRIFLYGRTDGQTDMSKLRAAFRNFANAPKIIQKWVLASVL